MDLERKRRVKSAFLRERETGKTYLLIDLNLHFCSLIFLDSQYSILLKK